MTLILLALLATADGVYLTLVHIDYVTGHAGLQEVCHALSAKGCSVTAGRFGHVAGIPVATIGFAGALTTALLGIAAWRRRALADDPLRSVLLLLSAGSVLASLLMATFSMIEGSFCPFCILWYVLNAGLLACAVIARNRYHSAGDTLDDALGSAGFAAMALFSVALVGGTFAYNQRKADLIAERDAAMEANAEAIAAGIVAEIVAKPPKNIAMRADAPRKGAENPEVVIVEYGDFQCPHCRRLWSTLEEYLQRTNRRVSLVFANFPLDASCNSQVDTLHPDACKAAVAAECAGEQDAFWKYGQKLFDNQDALADDDLRSYAEDLGLDLGRFDTCRQGGEAAARVKQDIDRGMLLDIRATPTFYIDGYEVTGTLPTPILAAVVDGILARREGGKAPQ